MKKIKASAVINIDKLRNNELADLIPEVYELKAVVENNPWHNNDSVFNHTLNVLVKLQGLLKNVKGKISDYLAQKVTNHTREDLLFLATLFHDIGKKETLLKKNGKAYCFGHEEVSATKVKRILAGFDLSAEEKDFVTQLVKFHGLPNSIVRADNDRLAEEFSQFKRSHSNIFPELVLFTIADTLGSQLADNDKGKFDFLINFYKRVLSEY